MSPQGGPGDPREEKDPEIGPVVATMRKKAVLTQIRGNSPNSHYYPAKPFSLGLGRGNDKVGYNYQLRKCL